MMLLQVDTIAQQNIVHFVLTRSSFETCYFICLNLVVVFTSPNENVRYIHQNGRQVREGGIKYVG